VGGAGLAEADDVLKAQQPAHNDSAVGPRARPCCDQPVPPRLNRPARLAIGSGGTVAGDSVLDVIGVPGELAAGDVRPAGAVFFDFAGLLTHDFTLCPGSGQSPDNSLRSRQASS